MCLIAFAYRQHKEYPLIMIANRDEFYARPTQTLGFWSDQPDILAGRDLEQMGTWLGINRNGHLAALTNYRDGSAQMDGKLSRGELTRGLLESNSPVMPQLSEISCSSDQYAGFNLLAGDHSGLYYLNHFDKDPNQLSPGLYGVSNAVLNSPWPKTQYLKERLRQVMEHNPGEIDPETLTELLMSNQEAPDEQLPDTGISKEWEKHLSACFIKLPTYGTRASSVILQRKDGTTLFRETCFDLNGLFKTAEYTLQCTPVG